MRASRIGTGVVFSALVAAAALAAPAEPKPKVEDIKALKDKAMVFVDAKGGTYVVIKDVDTDQRKVYYGTAKILYSQRLMSSSRNGDAWSMSAWAPRLSDLHPGSIDKLADGTFRRWCDGKDDAVLTQVTGDKAKKVLDTYTFMSPALVRIPFLFARDDTGVYYYVDAIRENTDPMALPKWRAHRVFVGKKGAMKQVALTDVASDSAGSIFSSKTGDLRLVKDGGSSKPEKISWVKGNKKVELVWLDLDVNSPLIFSDLGIYTFIGTLCDNV